MPSRQPLAFRNVWRVLHTTEDFYGVGQMSDLSAIWAEMASDLRTHAIPQCGHLPHEEQSKAINRLLLDFPEGWSGVPR